MEHWKIYFSNYVCSVTRTHEDSVIAHTHGAWAMCKAPTWCELDSSIVGTLKLVYKPATSSIEKLSRNYHKKTHYDWRPFKAWIVSPSAETKNLSPEKISRKFPKTDMLAWRSMTAPDAEQFPNRRSFRARTVKPSVRTNIFRL